MRKALFFDLDGTIVSDITGEIPQSTKNALKKAKENGHILFVNTGRTICRIGQEIKDLGFDGYLCGCGVYLTYHDRVVFEKKIEKARMKEIVDMAVACNIDGVFENHDAVYYSKEKSRFANMEKLKALYKKEGLPQGTYIENGDYVFNKFYVNTDENSDIDRFFALVSADFEIIDREYGAYEFIPKGYSKGTAMEMICAPLGITKENFYAFGDSGNDITMFKAAGHRIAMGAHSKLIARLTDFVTKTVENDGIEYALKHFDLI